jgi:hypothetical protein
MAGEQRPRGRRPSTAQIRRITWAAMISIVTLGWVALRLDAEIPLPVLVALAVVAGAGVVVLVVTTIRILRR